MEIWKDTLNTATLDGASNWYVTANYQKNGGYQTGLTPAFDSTNLWWAVTIPYQTEEATITVNWTFVIPGASGGTFYRTDTFEVITPILNSREIKNVWPNFTDQEVKDAEVVARYIIQAHTGQSFGKRTRSRVVRGNGDYALPLPERLMTLTGLETIYSILEPTAAIVIADGWYIKKRWSTTTPKTVTDDLYFGGEGGDVGPWSPDTVLQGDTYIGTLVSRGAPISIGTKASYWKDDYPFTITGTWGWPEVPIAVKEAAKLLVNDYGCADSLYRDRYLESVKSADWRLQFNKRAYESTGNVRADQLLDQFVIRHLSWAII